MPTVSVTNKCQNRCLMCTNTKAFLSEKKQLQPLAVLKRVYDFSRGENVFVEKFADSFYLSGGEPTLSPKLSTITNEIRTYFPSSKIICLTNGRRFSNMLYAKEFFKKNDITDVAVSVLGPNAVIHDEVTASRGSFVETLSGIGHIYRFKPNTTRVQIRIVVSGLNYRYLKETLSLLDRCFKKRVTNIIVIFFEIEGMAESNFEKLRLSYDTLRPFLKSLSPFLKKIDDFRLYHFPLCVLPLELFPYTWRTLEPRDVAFIQSCKKCIVKKYCLGIPKSYLKYFGGREFKAMTKNIKVVPSNNRYHPISNV